MLATLSIRALPCDLVDCCVDPAGGRSGVDQNLVAQLGIKPLANLGETAKEVANASHILVFGIRRLPSIMAYSGLGRTQ